MSVATTIRNFLSTSEAADELGITESLVRRYIRQRRLVVERVGKRAYLITRRSLESFKKIPRKPGPKPD